MQAHASPRCYMRMIYGTAGMTRSSRASKSNDSRGGRLWHSPPSLGKIGMGKDLSPYSFAKNIDFYSTGGIYK